MNSLIIYDSNYGSTKKISQAIAEKLNAKVVSVDAFKPTMLNNIELLIVGSPIIGWRPTEKMAHVLSNIPSKNLEGMLVTTFDTRVKLFIHGDAMQKMLNSLLSAGAVMLTKPMPFYVKGKEGVLFEGELEKAIAWAKDIQKVRIV